MPNANLANSSITIGSTVTSLGAASTSLTGLTGLSSTSANISGSIVVGAPTGGSEGTGTVNATGLYINGVAAGLGNVTASAMTANRIPLATSATVIGNYEMIDAGSGGVAVGSATGGQMGAGTLNATNLYVNGTAVTTTVPPVGATPTAAAGDVAIPGTSPNFIRADGAPAIQKLSATQFGIGKVDGTSITAVGGVISAAAGNYTPTFFVGTVAGTNSYTSTPTQPYPANTPYNVFCGQFANANTTTATLNLNGIGAITIAKQVNGALLSLAGGEIQGSNTTQCFQLNSAGTAWTMQAAPSAGVTADISGHTVTVVEWAYQQVFTFSTSGKTLTLPSAATLSNNGLIAISTLGQSVTLQPQSGDGITSASVGANGASLTIPANTFTIVTTSGAAGAGAFKAPIRPVVAGFSDLTGSASCAQLPALTGDVTTPAGSCATTSTFHKISTQTASGAASMQWTGLGTSYNDYVLQCPYVYPGTDHANVFIQFGEGATPTWQSANYVWMQSYVNSGASPAVAAGGSATTDSGINVEAGGVPGVVNQAASIRAIIYNIPSSTYYQNVSLTTTIAGNGSSTSGYFFSGGGSFVGDTTPKTAVRVIAASGTITGSCSLWGIVVP